MSRAPFSNESIARENWLVNPSKAGGLPLEYKPM